jgi:hypothetical protein
MANEVVVLGKEETAMQPRSAMDIATTRAAQEIQAAMVIAKKFPRDINASYSRIMQACKRVGVAETAEYAYPRGDTTVGGPSIRLAEVLAQNWGNIDYGIIELEQKQGESNMMAYAWDLETNSRQTKVFTVKHERHTKRGTMFLSDPRDIYEMTANQGARRLRACVLGIIPKDIVDDALKTCSETLSGSNKEPIGDRIKKMASAFSDYNVAIPMIETRLGHKLETTSETELIALRKIYLAIKDNMASVDSYFTKDQPKDGEQKGKSKTETLAGKLRGSSKKNEQQPEPPSNPPEPEPERKEPEQPSNPEEEEKAAIIAKIEKFKQYKPMTVSKYLASAGVESLDALSLDDCLELLEKLEAK